ncbi:MAG: hypothetical protein NTX50_25230 [Candidatus Sumerlaeota bacterium]|nr:hypothetical protein [Candidatus Sumerlaeota bacterium]
MKKIDKTIPQSLREVWGWKEAVYQDIKDKSTEERIAYYNEGLEIAAKILNAKIVVNPDGSRMLV